MKYSSRCTDLMIAVLLVPFFSPVRILPSSRLCPRADIVYADTRDMSAVPPLVLWAWERPEDLRFLDPTTTGVAFLAETVRVAPAGVAYIPRMQPLRVPPQTRLVAVVRIETAAGAVRDKDTPIKIAREIARAARLPRVVAVQVDFDATVSERAFYRDLLVELRRQLPGSIPISITALASWCIGDRWMNGLPIDEAVPMLFRMGVGQAEVTNWMRSGHDFQEATCRTSLGVSLDEHWSKLPLGRRVYAFSPSPWTKRSFENLVAEINTWR